MNEWIKKSIELAFGEFYLDNLLEIYPPDDVKRGLYIKNETTNLKKFYDEKKCYEFIQELLCLKKKKFKFPIDHPYVSFLSYSKEDMIKKNPKTAKKICDFLFKLDYNELTKRLEAPKKASRKMGPMFKNWLIKNFHFANSEDIKKSNDITFLKGSDAVLKEFAKKELNCQFGELSKGLDFIVKTKKNYIIGTAKFVTSLGGGQGNAFFEAMRFMQESKCPENVMKIAVIDGVAYLGGMPLEYLNKSKDDEFYFSALVLKDFLNKI